MAFDSLQDFLAMGEHGVYVWVCWGIVIISVLLGILKTYHDRQQVIKTIKDNQKRTEHRQTYQATK